MAPDRYTCEEAFRRLDDYVDRELSAAEQQRVAVHLETCAMCAEEYVFEASLLRMVRERLARIAAPTSLRARVAALLADR
jgi:anti-sigma factor (TIGR02949 family)